ncbi:MAG: efflux RND transporter periplasmic adaptor subunit [Thermodesulfobacteriota bacterium]
MAEITPGKSLSSTMRCWRSILVVILVLAATVLAGLLLRPTAPPSHDHTAELVQYTCPMHPEIITDAPGQCPICGMDLVKIEAVKQQEEKPVSAGTEDDFFSDLKEPDEAGALVIPTDRETIHIGPEALKASGVQTTLALRDRISRTVRAAGLITADETRIRHVHTKVDGWVEGLAVNFNGQLVTAGQPILSLYSPTLLASQEEFLRARETAATFSTNEDEGLRKLGRQLFAASRRRLELFDVPTSFIDTLEKNGTTSRTVMLNAPVAGFVTAKSIFEGQQIVPGQELYTITDLSRVWIEANFYEYEANQVRVGQEAELTLPHMPELSLRGKATYIYPFLSPESRTLKVRFEFDNPDLILKPAMYADVRVELAETEGVVVPESAVMATGTRSLAFVEIEPGTFEPREIVPGLRGNGRVQILSGVRAGETVVVKANFLLDSESRLRANTARVMKEKREKAGEQK